MYMIFYPTCSGRTNEITFQNIGFWKHLDSSTCNVCCCFGGFFALNFDFFWVCVAACLPGCGQNDPRQQVWYEWQEGRLQGEGRVSKYPDTPPCPCLLLWIENGITCKKENIKCAASVMMISVKSVA